MKSVKICITAITVLFLATLIVVSCTKSFEEKIPAQRDFSNSSLVQVHVATVGAARNFVYVDGKAVTGALMVSGSTFPSAANSFVVEPGLRSFTIRDTLRTTTQTPLTFSENMQVGQRYTIFTYDTITAVKQLTVPTDIVVPSDTTARLRFANFIYAPFALPAVDVYSFVTGANLFTNVQVKSVTNFIPYRSRITDTLYIRETGTMNQLHKITIIGGLSEKRSYTLVYRGSHRGTRTSSLLTNY